MDPVAVVVDGRRSPFTSGSPVRVGGLEVLAVQSEVGHGLRLDLTVRNPGTDVASAHRVGIVLSGAPELVLEHGYQSWSVVRRCAPSDVRPDRRDSAEWGRATHVADPERAGEVVVGDQFLVTDEGVVGFLDGRHHLSIVEARPDGLHALALLDDVPIEPGEARALDPIWCASGEPGPLYSEYATRWGATAGARVDATAPVGWCSWYHYFGEVTPGDIRKNLALASELGLGLVQIDDGWQRAIGDWSQTSEGWGEPMSALADEIRASGITAGIWTAPFIAAASSRVATDHPEWIAAHRSGHPLRAMYNDTWGGWALGLDTTNPAVVDHLRSLYSSLRAEGFDYHKIDFCYAAAVPARRHDATQTRGQALRAGLEAVREGIGDDAFLLGCGCPFGPAVGVVDAMRVSADVAPTWEAERSWPGFAETAPAAVNAIAASVLRAPLHRRVFINDPDCLLLRPGALEPAHRDVLAATIAGCGGFTVLSDDMSTYGEAERAMVRAAQTAAVAGDRPLDLLDPFATPLAVVSPRYRLDIDWLLPSATLTSAR